MHFQIHLFQCICKYIFQCKYNFQAHLQPRHFGKSNASRSLNRFISAMLTLNSLTMLRLMRQADRMGVCDRMETRRGTPSSGDVNISCSRRRRCLVAEDVDLVILGVHRCVAARPGFSAAAQREIHRSFCEQFCYRLVNYFFRNIFRALGCYRRFQIQVRKRSSRLIYQIIP